MVHSTARTASSPAGAFAFRETSELARLVRAHDWSSTPLGSLETWPAHLRTAMGIALDSRFPIVLYWGPDLITLYNDGYAPILAGKHPWALGRPCRVVWAEIWDVIGPMLEQVRATGEATWSDDQLLLLERHGFPEECYFSFSFSPVRGPAGQVDGIFTAVTENTTRVVGERRLGTLRDLGVRTANLRSEAAAGAAAAAVLAENAADVPFALIYRFDDEGTGAGLIGAAGLPPEAPARPAWVSLTDDGTDDGWSLRTVFQQREAMVLRNLAERWGDWPGGLGPPTPTAALVLPIGQPALEQPIGALVVGLSPRRPLEADYRDFLTLVAGHVASAIASARAYAAERQRADALAELNRAKTTFFSNVSHEFRTPLTLLLGPAEDALADERTPLPPGQRERVELIQRNALRLQRLVNTLLDFARLEAGRIEVVYEPTDLASLTADLVSAFRSLIEAAGLQLRVDCPPLPEPVYVDRDMWEKIVLNLLSNAFKFTFAGEIAISLALAGDAVELVVRDTGTGIPPEELPRLFERFHRVQTSRSRTQEGSGIGLALVQELVRLHGGTIAVSSAVDEGSTFSVRIPRGQAHLPAARLGAVRTLPSTTTGVAPYLTEAQRWLPTGIAASGKVAALEAEVSDRLGGLVAPRFPAAPLAARILVADDNADMREYLGRLLGGQWEVEAVGDGLTALTRARDWRPNLILADVMMSGLDGFALLDKLRADPATAEIPVVLLSARAGEEAAVEGLSRGADDYLVKPFSARELVARVSAHLSLAQLRAAALRREQAARAAIEAERQHLYDLLMQVPALVAIVRGPDHVFELTNAPYVELVGRPDPEALLGRPARQALPELADQGYFELLDRVYQTGERFVGTNMLVRLDRRRDGSLADVYLNLVYEPLRDEDGAVSGIFFHAVDVTDHVQARHQLEAALRSRDEFLGIAAHELRTPVTGIKASAQLLQRTLARERFEVERLRRYVGALQTAADRLATLTNDLLDVSRIRSGRLALQQQAVDLHLTVEEVVERFRDQLDERERVQLRLADQPAEVIVDCQRLEQVLVNLLDNAVKYSPGGGVVQVTSEVTAGEVILRIQDHGIGLPAGDLETIFEPFGRAANATRAHLPGMGLGLFICRNIIERHGGRLWAESPGDEQGTTMVVTLPRTGAAERAG